MIEGDVAQLPGKLGFDGAVGGEDNDRRDVEAESHGVVTRSGALPHLASKGGDPTVLRRLRRLATARSGLSVQRPGRQAANPASAARVRACIAGLPL